VTRTFTGDFSFTVAHNIGRSPAHTVEDFYMYQAFAMQADFFRHQADVWQGQGA
jgi:hypothetical protein